MCGIVTRAEIGPHLRSLEDGKAANPFPLHQTYFAVFDSNASLLGRIPDRKLREQIISTYIEAKGFIDSMHYYERLVTDYESRPESSPFSMRSDAEAYSEIVSYSAQLKQGHVILEAKVNVLKERLQAYLDPR